MEGLEKHLYNGKHYNDETGLYHYGWRYYDPETGRFTTPDKRLDFSTPVGLNLYVYCRGSPLRYIDPSGRARRYTYWDVIRNFIFWGLITWEEVVEVVLGLLLMGVGFLLAYFTMGKFGSWSVATLFFKLFAEFKGARSGGSMGLMLLLIEAVKENPLRILCEVFMAISKLDITGMLGSLAKLVESIIGTAISTVAVLLGFIAGLVAEFIVGRVESKWQIVAAISTLAAGSVVLWRYIAPIVRVGGKLSIGVMLGGYALDIFIFAFGAELFKGALEGILGVSEEAEVTRPAEDWGGDGGG